MEEVEVPRGLIRSWKMWVAVALSLLAGGSGGWFGGHRTARVVEKPVEVPPASVCLDVLLPIENDRPVACTHPQHHGTVEKHDFTGGCEPAKDTLRCSCPQPTIEFADAGAK